MHYNYHFYISVQHNTHCLKKFSIHIFEEALTCFFMRRNSLDLNSFLADFWRRSMKSSPLRSTTSSVVFPLISFSSASLFDIITTIVLPDDDETVADTRAETWCWILTPWNEDEVEVAELAPRRKVAAVPGEVIERLSIAGRRRRRYDDFTREAWEDNEANSCLISLSLPPVFTFNYEMVLIVSKLQNKFTKKMLLFFPVAQYICIL